jgi:hypothetical protein
MREPPGGPRSGGEAMSEAKPVRWRPCEAGARPNNNLPPHFQTQKRVNPYTEFTHFYGINGKRLSS